MKKRKNSEASARISAGKPPGRVYTFVAALLATFMLGLTGVAFQSLPAQQFTATTNATAPSEALDTQTQPISTHREISISNRAVVTQKQIQRLGTVALGIALLTLIPSRGAAAESDDLTHEMVAQQTGLPIAGSLFSKDKSAAKSRRNRRRWLQGFVSLCELLLCTAFMLTVAACFVKPELVTVLRNNPLAGYIQAIHVMASTVNSWINPSLALT